MRGFSLKTENGRAEPLLIRHKSLSLASGQNPLVRPPIAPRRYGARADRTWRRETRLAGPRGDGSGVHQLSRGRSDRLRRVTTASQERFSSCGYFRSKQ